MLPENRPGILAQLTGALASAGINIEGCAEVEGIFHVLTESAIAARRTLEEAGFPIREEQHVLVIDVDDKPGVIAEIFRHIADADVNVSFMYVATNNRVVVGASNLQKVIQLFSKEASNLMKK